MTATSDHMESATQTLAPIPVDFVVGEGLALKQEDPARRPLVALIEHWAEKSGDSEAARPYVAQLMPDAEQTASPASRSFSHLLTPKYRHAEKIAQLKEILAELDLIIVQNTGRCTWMHVMRVMKDAAIINTNIISQFGNLICWLLPYNKKVDAVRKSGTSEILKPERPWHRWRCDGSTLKHDETFHYEMCKEVSRMFESLTD